MEVGIIGLPNAGKTTLFNALTNAGAEVAAYPFTTIGSNVGIAEVPDERLHQIAKVVSSEKVVPATVRFVDIAGLVRGASRGEGLGNQFLGHIREVDAIAHVVRCFESPTVSHVEGGVDPQRDIEVVELELILADLKVAEAALEKVEKKAKSGDKEALKRADALSRAKRALEAGKLLKSSDLGDEDRKALAGISFLTDKPVIYVANATESEIGGSEGPAVSKVKEMAKARRAESVEICAKLEEELADLSDEEANEYLAAIGLEERGLDRLAEAAYRLLNLVTFFTIESGECRAWPVKAGTKAPAAAGKIHTDMERGFIKAEVVPWRVLVESGSFAAAREKGLLLVEGKEYVVRDGDVILFKFAA